MRFSGKSGFSEEMKNRFEEIVRDKFPFQSRYLTLSRGRIHYVDEGRGNVILFTHACPVWIFAFRRLIAELSKQYRVIAMDQMGFGLSDTPWDSDYTVEANVADLEFLVNFLKINDITMISQGRGTVINMAFAIRHPDLVRGFFTMNSMSFDQFKLPMRLQLCRFAKLGARMIELLHIFTREIRWLPPDISLQYRYPLIRSKSLALRHFIEDIPCNPEDDSASFLYEVEAGMWLIREKPVKILWAGKDWMYPVKYLNIWQNYFPKAKVVVLSNVGRMITEECPDALLEQIHEFMLFLDETEKQKKKTEKENDVITYHEYFPNPGTGKDKS